MNTQPITKPFKIVYDHGEYCEMRDPEGNTKRYTRSQVDALKSLMSDFEFHTVVFKDYSKVRV